MFPKKKQRVKNVAPEKKVILNSKKERRTKDVNMAFFFFYPFSCTAHHKKFTKIYFIWYNIYVIKEETKMTLEEKYKMYQKKKAEREKERNTLEAEMKTYQKQYEEKKNALLEEYGMDSIEEVRAKIAAEREELEKEKKKKEAELDKYLAE